MMILITSYDVYIQYISQLLLLERKFVDNNGGLWYRGISYITLWIYKQYLLVHCWFWSFHGFVDSKENIKYCKPYPLILEDFVMFLA